jgi:hypothetical protein
MVEIKIYWETDGDYPEIPEKLYVDEDLTEDNDALCKFLSDKYGYLVYDWEVIPDLRKEIADLKKAISEHTYNHGSSVGCSMRTLTLDSMSYRLQELHNQLYRS